MILRHPVIYDPEGNKNEQLLKVFINGPIIGQNNHRKHKKIIF